MKLEPNKYYHFFNRSNNKEIVFKSRENFLCFLSKYHKYPGEFVGTLAYCLMPDHFHFLICIKTASIELLKKNIGILLSSYTKAINKAYKRTGSLFQQHSKMKLLRLKTYTHSISIYTSKPCKERAG
jgi:putative transposase